MMKGIFQNLTTVKRRQTDDEKIRLAMNCNMVYTISTDKKSMRESNRLHEFYFIFI